MRRSMVVTLALVVFGCSGGGGETSELSDEEREQVSGRTACSSDDDCKREAVQRPSRIHCAEIGDYQVCSQCETDSDCAGDREFVNEWRDICSRLGRCIMCESDDDCPRPEFESSRSRWCVEGACRECEANAHCREYDDTSPGAYCTAEQGEGGACERCLSDAHCEGDKVCTGERKCEAPE